MDGLTDTPSAVVQLTLEELSLLIAATAYNPGVSDQLYGKLADAWYIMAQKVDAIIAKETR